MDEQSLGLLGEEGAAPLGGEVQKQVTSGSGMQGRLSVIWCQVMLSASEQKKKSSNTPGSFAARFWSLLQVCRERIHRKSSTPKDGRLGMKILANLSHTKNSPSLFFL